MSATAPKVPPMNIRVKEDQREFIERAARAKRKTISEFVRDAALDSASHVLLDNRIFVFDAEKYAQFLEAIDAPAQENLKLRELLAGKPIWES